MRDTAGEVETNSWGPLHMDEQRQDDQREPIYNSSVLIQDVACGDLGINSKNSQPDIDSSAARYKMYKRVATHKAPRIHPVKIKKRKIIKCKVANGKRSRQN